MVLLRNDNSKPILVVGKAKRACVRILQIWASVVTLRTRGKKMCQTLNHCIPRHHISQVGHLGGLFIDSAGIDLLWVGEVFVCLLVHNVGVR